MDPATSPAVTRHAHPARVDDEILIDADLVIADISDRTLRLALLLAWHDDVGSVRERHLQAVNDATLALQLRCSLHDVRAAWAELEACRGLADGLSIPRRHQCVEVDW